MSMPGRRSRVQRRRGAQTGDAYTPSMPTQHRSRFVRATRLVPGLRRLPALQLAAVAEVLLLARDHARLLTPSERRRVATLLRAARGRPRNLSDGEREELLALIDKLEPRRFAGGAIDAVSPVHLPRRVVYGRRRRRP